MIYFKDISGREHFAVGHGQGITLCPENRRVIHKETTARNIKTGSVPVSGQLQALQPYFDNPNKLSA